jgi:PASTA domain
MAIALASLGVGLTALAESSGSSPAHHAAKSAVSVTVPNVLGQSQKQAVTSLEAVGLRTETRTGAGNAPVGTVVVESPKAGASVHPSSVVSLTVSNGTVASPALAQPPTSTSVPNTAPRTTTAPLAASPPSPSKGSCSGQMDCCPAANVACTPPVITYNVGQTGTLSDGGQVQLATILVSAPTFSTTDANGDTSQFGYFATFMVTVTDIAPSSQQDETINPSDLDFYVQLPNGQLYGSGDQDGVQGGYSAAAAGPNELGINSVGGSITLSPGQSTTGTVTIDMPGQSGLLYYAGGGQIDGAWSF